MVSLLTDIVLAVTGFQLLLLAGVLLSRPAAQRLRRNLLGAFLLIKATMILRWAVFRHGILTFETAWPLYFLSSAGFFLLAPVLYLYIRSLCQPDLRLRGGHLRHGLLPAGVILFTAAAVGQWAGTGDEAPGGIWGAVLDHYWTGFWTLNLLQILGYMIAMWSLVIRYRRALDASRSNRAGLDLGWVRWLLAVGSLHWLFVASRSGLALAGLHPQGLLPVLDLFSITIFLVFTTALVAKALGRLDWVPPVAPQPAGAGGKYSTSPLSREALAAWADRLEHVMQTRKPHLDPALTVDQLAAALGLPSYQLSQVVNVAFGTHFFNFVNRFRVEEAMGRLRDPAFDDQTMLRILYESGFNSKSSFNAAFKRHVGMTPSDYRRLHRPAPGPSGPPPEAPIRDSRAFLGRSRR